MSSKIRKLIAQAAKDSKFRKVWTPTAQGAEGARAWQNADFRVDRGGQAGQRVLQVNAETQQSTLKKWIRDQGKKSTHAALAKFQVVEKSKDEVTDTDVSNVLAKINEEIDKA